MRPSYFLITIMVIVTGVSLWYLRTENECPVPLAYALGDIDPAFNLTSDEALSYIDQAAQVWEVQSNRDLFYYDENADLKVNFIYDDRQAEANSEASERETLDEKRDENSDLIATIEQLQTQYDTLSAEYERKVNDYKARLAAYNQTVNQYNDRGGAPQDVYDQLEVERDALDTEAAGLNDTADQLNQLAAKVNELGERGQQLVNEYNREVAAYNEEFGFAREFTQGDYTRDQINVYKFSSDDELVTVLAHEFGHALGIDHVAATSSLMYYLLDETDFDPTLSADDMAAYHAVCGVKETLSQRLRHAIRTLLHTI